MKMKQIGQMYSPNGTKECRSGQEKIFCYVYRSLLCALFVAAALLSIASPLFGSSRFSTLLDEAYDNNEGLLSMEENVRALRAEAPFSGSLRDPVVGIGVLNLPVDTFDFDQEPMTQKQLFASQKFPWFGTLDLRQQASELKALEADFQLRTKRLEIARNLADSWHDLGFVGKALEINANLQTIVLQVLRVAETRYGTGEGLQQDILAGQVKHSELIDERVNLESRERVVRAQIGSLLNRSGLFEDKGPISVEEPADIPERVLLNRISIQLNPLLQARKIAIDRAKVEVQLAEKAYLPDFDLRLAYGDREDNPDFVSATLGLTIPLWQSTSQDSKLAAAQKRLTSAKKSLLGLRQTLPHSIERVLAQIEGAKDSYSLMGKELSVQAANLADASLAAYSVGKIEFNTMLSARIQLLRIQLKAERYKYQIYKKMAELEELIGTNLSSLEDLK